MMVSKLEFIYGDCVPKMLAVQAEKHRRREAKQRLFEPESDATDLLKCHRTPKPRKFKTKSPNNKKRLSRQEPYKMGSGSRGPAPITLRVAKSLRDIHAHESITQST